MEGASQASRAFKHGSASHSLREADGRVGWCSEIFTHGGHEKWENHQAKWEFSMKPCLMTPEASCCVF